jgi:hypothetical protein
MSVGASLEGKLRAFSFLLVFVKLHSKQTYLETPITILVDDTDRAKEPTQRHTSQPVIGSRDIVVNVASEGTSSTAIGRTNSNAMIHRKVSDLSVSTICTNRTPRIGQCKNH